MRAEYNILRRVCEASERAIPDMSFSELAGLDTAIQVVMLRRKTGNSLFFQTKRNKIANKLLRRANERNDSFLFGREERDGALTRANPGELLLRELEVELQKPCSELRALIATGQASSLEL